MERLVVVPTLVSSSIDNEVVELVDGFANLHSVFVRSMVLAMVAVPMVAYVPSNWFVGLDRSTTSDIDSSKHTFNVSEDLHRKVLVTFLVRVGTSLDSDAIDPTNLAFAVAFMPIVQPWSREQIVEDESTVEIYYNHLVHVVEVACKTNDMVMVSTKP